MSDTLEGIILGGKYKIIRRLGRGGMAEVYLAHQESLDRNVAIKLMHAFLAAEEDFLHRFKREARAMAAMNHPNIVSVYDFDVYGESTYYLVMEYISGGTLKDRLAALAEKGERLPLETAVQIGIEVASALAYAHQRGMVHRDVKPANIMLNEEGRAILTDFGIVKLVGGQSMAYTATGALIGTPAYMSPEQALGKPGDARADIYALGTLLFQMTTGYLPFDADTPLAIVMKHVNEPVPLPASLNAEIPMALQAVILKAMAKNPDDRYQTAAELEMALQQVKQGSMGSAPALFAVAPQTTQVMGTAVAGSLPTIPGQESALTTAAPQTAVAAPALAAPKKRPYWLIALVALLAIGLTAVGAFSLFNGNDETGSTPQPIAALTLDTAVVPTNTPSPSATPTPTNTPTNTPDTAATIAAATAAAAINLTANAATATNTPTATPSATATPTQDATRAFLSTCTTDVQLVRAYTYDNTRATSAPVGVSFPINWTLRNSGTCPWPATLQWVYVEGERFAYTGEPLALQKEVSAGEEITLKATLQAPAAAGNYNSTWQLRSSDGQPFGPRITFTISAYVPATATPTAPLAPPTPTATATPGTVAELNYGFEIFGCEYINTEWRCTVRMWPIGGGGGPYTLLILDQPGGQATEFRGPWPITYFAMARRCAAYNQEVRVIDDGSRTDFSRHLYIDPNNYFPGGCTLP